MNTEYMSPSDAKRALEALEKARTNYENADEGRVKNRLKTIVSKYEKHEEELNRRAAMPKYSRITKR
jgi:hypothetical protein